MSTDGSNFFSPFNVGGVQPTPQPEFDIGFAVEMEPRIKSQLAVSDQTLVTIRNAINDTLMKAVASAAVSADQLRARIVESIRGAIGSGVDALSLLSNPVAQQIINELSHTLEVTAKFGVTPPMFEAQPSQQGGGESVASPNGSNLSLPPVAVGSQAVPGSQTLDQAVQRYYADVYPLGVAGNSGGYNYGVSQLTAAVGYGTPAAEALQQIILGAESSMPPLTGGSGGGSAGGAGSGSSGDFTTFSALQVTPGVQINGGNVDPQNYKEFLVAVANELAKLSCATLDSMVSRGDVVNVITTVSSGGYTLRSVLEKTGSNSYRLAGHIDMINIPNVFSIFPQGDRPWEVDFGCLQLLPPVPTDPNPPPTVPPPTVPPVPGPYPYPYPSQPCIPICEPKKPECPEPPPPPPKPQYDVYCIGEGTARRPAIVKKGDPPPAPGAKLIGSGSDPMELIQLALSGCGPLCPESPPYVPGSLPIHMVQGCETSVVGSGINVPLNYPLLSIMFGLRDMAGNFSTGLGITDLASPSAVVVAALKGFAVELTDQLSTLLNNFIKQTPCGSGQNIELITARAVLNFLSLFVGDALESVNVPTAQNQRYLCPQQLPDANEATEAWLSDNIDPATLECWVRSCGFRFPEWARVADARRSKLTALQTVVLYLRGKIDKAEYETRIRALGFVRPSDAGDIYELSQQIPPASDLVRFMVRDTGDEALVQKFGMDADFGAKFAGKIPDWAKAQGVSEDYMRSVWRAHWSIPSPTQLYEMYHRLRNLPDGDPRRVSLDEVKTALEQQDILPFWIEKLLAVSFAPLRLVDVRRAYYQGSIGEDEVKQALYDRGYNDTNANILLKFFQHEKRRRFAVGRDATLYRDNLISQQQFTEVVTDQGAAPEDVQYAITQIDLYREAQRRKKCIAAYRKRFLAGEFDETEIQAELIAQELDQNQVNVLVEAWKCEKANKGKHFSAAQLCELFEGGLITGAEFITRLTNVGWTHDDAVRLYSACQRRLGVKQAKSDAAKLRQEIREQQSLAREVQRQADKLKRDAAQQARSAEKLQRVNSARERMLLEAANNWVNSNGLDLYDALVGVRGLYRSLKTTTVNSLDDILRAIITATKQDDVPGVATLTDLVTSIIADQAGDLDDSGVPLA